jgi:hypothetical protein
MNERTHSWIALRAAALVLDNEPGSGLATLLAEKAKAASSGAWIPDQTDAKRAGVGNSTENHVLKVKPYQGQENARFTMNKEELLKRIGEHRAVSGFLRADGSLDGAWWSCPYKGDVAKPGQHIPNRIMALSTMLKDLLLMGDEELDGMIPGSIGFAKYLSPGTRTKADAAALYLAMASHFIADVSMPCHCDARALSAYGAGLHKELEAHWSRKLGTGFDKESIQEKRMPTGALLDEAREKDGEFGVSFAPGPLPSLMPDQDEWLEAMQLCRASFAVASIMAPHARYPYGGEGAAPFETLFGGPGAALLEELDRVILHDAVLNTAIFWKRIWEKCSKE